MIPKTYTGERLLSVVQLAALCFTAASCSSPSPIHIRQFSVDPQEISEKAVVRVSWEVEGATDVVLLPLGSHLATSNGNLEIEIEPETTLTLRASNAEGTIERSALVGFKAPEKSTPVTGRVRNRFGGPLAGALLRIGEEEVTSDSEGWFAFGSVATPFDVHVSGAPLGRTSVVFEGVDRGDLNISLWFVEPPFTTETTVFGNIKSAGVVSSMPTQLKAFTVGEHGAPFRYGSGDSLQFSNAYASAESEDIAVVGLRVAQSGAMVDFLEWAVVSPIRAQGGMIDVGDVVLSPVLGARAEMNIFPPPGAADVSSQIVLGHGSSDAIWATVPVVGPTITANNFDVPGLDSYVFSLALGSDSTCRCDWTSFSQKIVSDGAAVVLLPPPMLSIGEGDVIPADPFEVRWSKGYPGLCVASFEAVGVVNHVVTERSKIDKVSSGYQPTLTGQNYFSVECFEGISVDGAVRDRGLLDAVGWRGEFRSVRIGPVSIRTE